MPRIQRLVVRNEKAVYHIISRTTLEGLPIGEEGKNFFIELLKELGKRYFVDVFGFCVMGDHFHLILEIAPPKGIPIKAIRERFEAHYADRREWTKEEGAYHRKKWTSLSDYVKDLRQHFTVFCNKKLGRRGAFWSQRYKSMLLEKGRPLLYCLAYIDLNPVRAGVVETPESYRWNSIGYRKRTLKKNDFLSFDIGWPDLNGTSRKKALNRYIDFLHDAAQLRFSNEELEEMYAKSASGERIPGAPDLVALRRLRKQHRYFQDAGILGSREFVTKYYRRFKNYFTCKNEKIPQKIKGLDGIYSMKRLAG